MADGEQTVVKTYVPRYQKEAWVEHAEELEMSQSEFVRTMVQAGRSDISPGGERSSEATSGGEGLEERVLAVLRDADYPGWEELLARITGDVEDRLDDALTELQAENRIQYSGRRDGYTVVGDSPPHDGHGERGRSGGGAANRDGDGRQGGPDGPTRGRNGDFSGSDER
jgi:hypothetical protein